MSSAGVAAIPMQTARNLQETPDLGKEVVAASNDVHLPVQANRLVGCTRGESQQHLAALLAEREGACLEWEHSLLTGGVHHA